MRNFIVKYLGWIFAVVFLLAVIGSNSSEPTAAPVAEPRTVVKTQEVEVTTEVTPDSCVEALLTSEQLIQGPVMEIIDDHIKVINLVPRALEAGVYMDVAEVNAITREVKSMNRAANKRNAEIDRLGTQYRAAADDCLAGTDTNS